MILKNTTALFVDSKIFKTNSLNKHLQVHQSQLRWWWQLRGLHGNDRRGAENLGGGDKGHPTGTRALPRLRAGVLRRSGVFVQRRQLRWNYKRKRKKEDGGRKMDGLLEILLREWIKNNKKQKKKWFYAIKVVIC